MSNPQERQAGTSGSTMGYGQGQARGQEYEGQAGRAETERAADRGYAPAGRRGGEHRGAVVTFTAVGATLMILSGLWGVIVGLAALNNPHFVFSNPGTGYYYYWTNHGWGWVELILGIVVFAIGVCVFLGVPLARYVGAGVVVLAAVAHFMLIPYSPIFSILMIALDAFIIWALLSPRRVAGEL